MNISTKRNLLPIVLHRVVEDEDEVEEWEDIDKNTFQKILYNMGADCAILKPMGLIEGSGCLLTFDDGHLSDYEIVFPMLLKQNLKATFFIVIDNIGKKNYLSWSQILEMQQYGMAFGSHSLSHKDMTKLSNENVIKEFKQSKLILEEKLGILISSFSYPYGKCNYSLHKIGLSSGYSFLCTSNHGVIHSQNSVLPRNSIYADLDMNKIYKIMSPTNLKKLSWILEDFSKSLFKSALSEEGYRKFRIQISRLFR